MKSQTSPSGCASMQAALKAYRDSLGKQTEQRHYINEVGLLRYALTGNSRADYDLANPPIGRKRITRHIICLNTSLIAEGVAFEQRKRICREIVLKYKAQSLK
jgi:hypothetical protein